MRRFPWGLLGMVVLFLLLLASLVVMGDAAQNSDRFERLFLWLLAFHGLVLVVLGTLIIYQLSRLIVQNRDGVPGSRLTCVWSSVSCLSRCCRRRWSTTSPSSF